jgi:hypothetical protein
MAEQETLEDIMISGMPMELAGLCGESEEKKMHVRNFLSLIGVALAIKSGEVEDLRKNEFESLREIVEDSSYYKSRIEQCTDSQAQKLIWSQRVMLEITSFFHGKNLKKEFSDYINENYGLSAENARITKVYSALEDCFTEFLKEKKEALEKEDYELVSSINDYAVEMQRMHERLSLTFMKKAELYAEINNLYYPKNKINLEAQE